VVEKRLRVREELRIIRRSTTDTVETPITLRKQRAVIERLDSEGALITDNSEIKP